jgi:hypothetical protein
VVGLKNKPGFKLTPTGPHYLKKLADEGGAWISALTTSMLRINLVPVGFENHTVVLKDVNLPSFIILFVKM